MRGYIFNAGDNVDDQESFGLLNHFSKLHPQIQMTIPKKNAEYVTRDFHTPEKQRYQ